MNMSNVSMLLWALPVAVCLHVIEEFAFPGGLIRWIELHKPRRLKRKLYYVAVNAAAIVGGVIIALTAKETIGFCVFLWFVAFMAGNALSHIRASVQSYKYCPGSVTGGLFFLPMLVVSSWILLANALINWQSAVLNIASGVFVGFFVFSIDVRQKDRR
jgi:hypothetical protein